MTNEETIHKMTTEQLAEYLYYLGNGEEYCYGHCAYQDEAPCGRNCHDGIVKWLKSENTESLFQ